MTNPYHPSQSGDTIRRAEREPWHGLLVAVAIVGMSLLGIAAMMAQWLKEGWISRWWVPHDPILTLLLCGTIGAIVGLVSIPLVTPCLARHDWFTSAAKIYGVNFVIVVAYVLVKPTGLTGPLSAAVVAFVGVAAMAQILRTRAGFPNANP